MIVGDTHGKVKSWHEKMSYAKENGIQHILQVGDFGLWHDFDGQVYLDTVQKMAEDAKATVYAIGGNHEDWDHWDWYVNNLPTSRGFAMVRSRIALAPKMHKWRWSGKQFISAGGAVSVDRQYRLQREAGTWTDPMSGRTPKATGPRTFYWPNETLEDSDIELLKTWDRTADYLITHDCSNYTPFYSRLKNDPESEDHRRKIDEVIRLTKPKFHWHGHMHTKYDWVNNISHGYDFATQTYGLTEDDTADSWGILDTETDTFKFRGRA